MKWIAVALVFFLNMVSPCCGSAEEFTGSKIEPGMGELCEQENLSIQLVEAVGKELGTGDKVALVEQLGEYNRFWMSQGYYDRDLLYLVCISCCESPIEAWLWLANGNEVDYVEGILNEKYRLEWEAYENSYGT